MENIPQPADDAYTKGDCVRVYLPDEDVEAQYHGLVCEVVENNPDDLDELTEREIDRNHYQLRRTDTGELLPVQFRHSDLVPEAEWPRRD